MSCFRPPVPTFHLIFLCDTQLQDRPFVVLMFHWRPTGNWLGCWGTAHGWSYYCSRLFVLLWDTRRIPRSLQRDCHPGGGRGFRMSRARMEVLRRLSTVRLAKSLHYHEVRSRHCRKEGRTTRLLLKKCRSSGGSGTGQKPNAQGKPRCGFCDGVERNLYTIPVNRVERPVCAVQGCN
jgi:hypothetical protein